MKKTFNLIQEKFLVDGEVEDYATMYISKEEIVEETDREVFEEKFNVDIDSINYPVVTFDNSNNNDGWIYESHDDMNGMLEDANVFFKRKLGA